eukprot:scaffold116626_cov36-Cyclotella_meneghiniana.AAC.2
MSSLGEECFPKRIAECNERRTINCQTNIVDLCSHLPGVKLPYHKLSHSECSKGCGVKATNFGNDRSCVKLQAMDFLDVEQSVSDYFELESEYACKGQKSSMVNLDSSDDEYCGDSAQIIPDKVISSPIVVCNKGGTITSLNEISQSIQIKGEKYQLSYVIFGGGNNHFSLLVADQNIKGDNNIYYDGIKDILETVPWSSQFQEIHGYPDADVVLIGYTRAPDNQYLSSIKHLRKECSFKSVQELQEKFNWLSGKKGCPPISKINRVFSKLHRDATSSASGSKTDGNMKQAQISPNDTNESTCDNDVNETTGINEKKDSNECELAKLSDDNNKSTESDESTGSCQQPNPINEC